MMNRIRISRTRGDDRPVSYDGRHGPLLYVERQDNMRTVVLGPAGDGEVEYGPATPGPFGDIRGRIGDTKVVIRLAMWGAFESGRHAFEVTFGDEDYVLVGRGRRRPRPQLETFDGSVLATYSRRGGAISRSATAEQAILVALIGGSGIANLTVPQHWLPRH